jgi:ribonuclease BN (tRNA processing enzyme)
VAALVKNVDVLIYDTSFTDQEMLIRRGWGHSTWQEGIRIADAAGVGRLVLFHHDSTRIDKDLDAIAAAAVVARPGTVAAFEGLLLTL